MTEWCGYDPSISQMHSNFGHTSHEFAHLDDPTGSCALSVDGHMPETPTDMSISTTVPKGVGMEMFNNGGSMLASVSDGPSETMVETHSLPISNYKCGSNLNICFQKNGEEVSSYCVIPDGMACDDPKAKEFCSGSNLQILSQTPLKLSGVELV